MITKVRCKICGITRLEDALCAVAAGADALGFVFYAQSPRHVDMATAAEICRRVPPFVTRVGLFVDAEASEVDAVLAQVPLDLLQFHGQEPAERCRRHGRAYIKAIHMRDDTDILARMAEYPDAQGFLLDTYRSGVPGGTGEVFDWARIPDSPPAPVILAGGLTAQNVAAAVAAAHPYAVDVSGGVELSKGIKDPQRIQAFMTALDRAQSLPMQAQAGIEPV